MLASAFDTFSDFVAYGPWFSIAVGVLLVLGLAVMDRAGSADSDLDAETRALARERMGRGESLLYDRETDRRKQRENR